MNNLTQNDSLLIGSDEAIKKLAEKETVNLLVISDSHGYFSILRQIIKKMGPISDALVFCGDGISDIAGLINKGNEDKLFNFYLPPVISIVEGNGDCDRYPINNPEYKKGLDVPVYKEISIPIKQVFTAAGHKIFSTHGHRYNIYGGISTLLDAAETDKADLVFYGHTHIASAYHMKSMLVLNPGSCIRPRGGQHPCFAYVKISAKSNFYDYTFYEFSSSGDFPVYVPDFSPIF